MANLIIGIAVLAFIIVRQVTVRPLRESYILPLILAAIGVAGFAGYLQSQHGRHEAAITTAVAGSLVLAAVMGAVRTPTVRIWRQDGILMRQGNVFTALLWIASLGVHLGYDQLTAGTSAGHVGDSTIVLYFAVSLTIQRWILLARARHGAEQRP
jgi:hypothetical protein